MKFNSGLPPEKKGRYWLRIEFTDEHPFGISHSDGEYGWKCECHPKEILGLSERTKKRLKLGFCTITGWIELPDPSTLTPPTEDKKP